MNFTFKKEERLHKKKELEVLFKDGSSFFIFPFKVIHHEVIKNELAEENLGPSLKVAISVPKRRFKKAVDRNRLKRKIREAYRLNRNTLKLALSSRQKNVLIMLIYNADEQLPDQKIEDKIILILQRLQTIYAEDNK